jgi:hypothetical protein
MQPQPQPKQIELVNVEDLAFDPINPRLPSSKEDASNEEVFRYMLSEGKVTDLMLSISAQNYFPGEPLLVIPSKGKDKKYEVVEGNRRLAALKLLLNPNDAPIKKELVEEISKNAENRPSEVPVIKYGERSEVLLYLGYRHITGVDEWDSLAKARYLTQLKSTFTALDYKELLKVLAKLIGSRADYVHRLLSGYQVYKVIEDNNFYDIPNLNEEQFGFSLLTTALSYKGISNYVGINPDKNEDVVQYINNNNLKDITEWVFKETEGKTRIGESRNLKALNAIVAVPRALKVFKEGRSLDEARLLTDEPKEIFSNSIKNALRRLQDAKEQSHYATNPDDADLLNLKDISIIARELHAMVRAKMDDNELAL